MVAIDNLEQTERDYTVESAKRNAETAKLRAQAKETDKYTVEERQAFLEQSIENEKKNLEEQKAIADEKLRILIETAKQENDTSDEMANKIVFWVRCVKLAHL